MNRSRGKQGSTGGPSRRTPAAPAARRRLPIPWLPVGVIVSVLTVGALIAYLVWQAGQPLNLNDAAKAEADANPDLPGEYVNLPEIYDDNTAPHVTREVDFVEDGNSNPPAGGPMWGSSACGDEPDDAPPFCGAAPWGIYRTPWAPETLNHNLEHGGIIVWYNTSHEDFIDDLEGFIIDTRKGRQLVVSPFYEMEEETIAVTSWSRIDKFPISEYNEDRVEAFIDAHECRYNEGNC